MRRPRRRGQRFGQCTHSAEGRTGSTEMSKPSGSPSPKMLYARAKGAAFAVHEPSATTQGAAGLGAPLRAATVRWERILSLIRFYRRDDELPLTRDVRLFCLLSTDFDAARFAYSGG